MRKFTAPPPQPADPPRGQWWPSVGDATEGNGVAVEEEEEQKKEGAGDIAPRTFATCVGGTHWLETSLTATRRCCCCGSASRAGEREGEESGTGA